MSPTRFKEIRESMGLTQTDLSEIFGLSGRLPITHYETGFRRPSKLIAALMELFNQLPEKKSAELRDLILNEMRTAKKPKRKLT